MLTDLAVFGQVVCLGCDLILNDSFNCDLKILKRNGFLLICDDKEILFTGLEDSSIFGTELLNDIS